VTYHYARVILREQQHLKPVGKTGVVQTSFMPKPQDAPERVAWRKELAEKIVEGCKQMEADPELRKKIQSMTH